jgi:hypothetical protein
MLFFIVTGTTKGRPAEVVEQGATNRRGEK